MTRSQNLAPSGLLDPDAQNLLRAVGQDAERDVDGLVADEALVPDLDPDGVEEDQRINGVERPVLPFATFSSTASVTAEIRSGDTSMP
jgi:hypothetical protein